MEIKYIEIPKKSDKGGNLSFMESNVHIPFDVKRVYYIYDLNDDGNQRGDHAHYKTKQVLFCISGSVKIGFDDGKEQKEFVLDKSNVGIYIPPMIWHYMKDFSPGCIILVVASENYEEVDYIRNYENFINLIK
ncbi:FdtA/QdtA family cupin domain-containing protein [Candidatus Gracilibacteria bacterium]|nr:FdtA/QdtA family cupin domain-containing protein [Candidatus Gracilibacteria bacterium]